MGRRAVMGLPAGFQLEQASPGGGRMALPPGFQLEQAQQTPQPMPQEQVAPTPVSAPQMNAMQRRMGIRGARAGQGADDLLPNIGNAIGSAGYNAGGAVTDLATRAGASPEMAAGLGVAGNIATETLPMFAGGVIGAAAKIPEAMQSAGRWLMGKAVKPIYADHLSGDAARGIETMLKEGYSPTKGGVEAMQKRISDLGEEVKAALANSTATVNKNAVAQRLESALERFRTQVNPQADTAAIEKAWNEFLSHPDLSGKTDMSVQLAHAMKQGTYRAIGEKPYGELSGAATEAQKQLARGLKEEVSAAVPGVERANSLQGELINAKDLAQRAAFRESNNNPASLGVSIAAAHSNPIATLGLWANSSAAAKAAMARVLYSNAKSVPRITGGAYGATTGEEPDPAVLAEILRRGQ